MKNYTFILSVLCSVLLVISSCKEDFLNAKPSSEIVEPVTLENLSGLLENDEMISYVTPALPLLSDDDFEYVDYNSLNSAGTAIERNAYVWNKEFYEGKNNVKDWAAPYTAIFYANNVLANLGRIKLNDENHHFYQYIKGWALFIRSYNYFNLASTFCPAYDFNSASTDLGIPLRTKPGVDHVSQRSTLQETYDQILTDLNEAKILLAFSLKTPTDKKNRPSLASAFALEARIFLSMRDYKMAEVAAQNCLDLYSKLIDFNSLPISDYPFSIYNEETLYSTTSVLDYSSTVVGSNQLIVINKALVDSYGPGDLRKLLFLKPANGSYIMNQTYFGDRGYPYTGLAVDEVYLIKAECAARSGRTSESLSVINNLLIKRFVPGEFNLMEAQSPDEALALILVERRKELLRRGLRWMDLKRFNKEGANLTLIRVLNNVTYTLPPNDVRYVFPIPEDEIAISKIIQNPR